MLFKLLNEFKDFTIQLNDLLENDNIESIEELLNKRQSIIEEINNISYSKDEFQKIVCDLNIMEEESKLKGLLNMKLIETKKDIESNKKEMAGIKKQRTVNKMYVNINPLDPVFLSKKY